MHLQTVMLYVTDFALMREFYRKMLQVDPTGDDTWALFDLGSTRFALHAIPARTPEARSGLVARELSPLKLIFAVEDIAVERARLETIGAVMLEKPWQKSGQSCDAMDPEGNVFQIASSNRE